MTEELRIAMQAQAEARAAFNGLPEDASTEDVAKRQSELLSADQALANALAAWKPDDSKAAPDELRDRVALGNYMTAVADESELKGAEAELNKELGLRSNTVPLEALVERRADAVSPQDTGGDALDFGTIYQTTGPMLNRVFKQTDTAYLGITMPMVPPGERVYPVMTDGTDAAMVARGSSAPDAKAAKFAVVNAEPHRLSARYVFDLEGVATLGGMLESTLRSDLRLAMGYALDQQVLMGDGTGANVSGLTKLLTAQAYPALSGAAKDPVQLTWLNSRQWPTSTLDGLLARTEGDIRLLLGQATYTAMRGLFTLNQSSQSRVVEGQDAVQALAALGSTARLSFQLPAPGNNLANNTKKTQLALWSVEPGAAVAPVWQGITMIRDPYTEASKGQIVLTAHMLFDFILRRTMGWKLFAVNPDNEDK